VKVKNVDVLTAEANKALVRMLSTLRFVRTAQLGRYTAKEKYG